MNTMMVPGQSYGGYGGSYGGYGGGYGNGYHSGGYPGQMPGQFPGQMPGPMSGSGEYQQTLPGAHTGGVSIGSSGGFLGGFAVQPNEGYGLDFNRNGRYDRGRDGVLVFDTNRDGKFEQKDVQNTNNMMQAATGNFDFNNNGKVSFAERIQGAALRKKFQQLDRNRDGQLSAQEISQGGGGVWTDRNQNGKIGNGEVSSAFNIPSNGRFGPTERLDFVDPFRQTSHTSSNGAQNGPFGGGGYPGCGCGQGGSQGFGYGNSGFGAGQMTNYGGYNDGQMMNYGGGSPMSYQGQMF